MKRNEACAFLTRIASDELFDFTLSKYVFKARDIVICENNRILDALSDSKTRDANKAELINLLQRIEETEFIDYEIRKKAMELWTDLCSHPNDGNADYYKKCEVMFTHERCKNCPNFIGFEDKE